MEASQNVSQIYKVILNFPTFISRMGNSFSHRLILEMWWNSAPLSVLERQSCETLREWRVHSRITIRFKLGKFHYIDYRIEDRAKMFQSGKLQVSQENHEKLLKMYKCAW